MVKVLDHFTIAEKEQDGILQCFIYYVGEIISEDDEYLRIRSKEITWNRLSSDIESGDPIIHNVMKSAIKARKDIEIEWDEPND